MHERPHREPRLIIRTRIAALTAAVNTNGTIPFSPFTTAVTVVAAVAAPTSVRSIRVSAMSAAFARKVTFALKTPSARDVGLGAVALALKTALALTLETVQAPLLDT